MACSLARIPYCTLADKSTRAVAVARAGPGPASPVYQVIVLAGVPWTSVVAVPNGEVPMRSGGTVAGAGGPKTRGAKKAGVVVVNVQVPAVLGVLVVRAALFVGGKERAGIDVVFWHSRC